MAYKIIDCVNQVAVRPKVLEAMVVKTAWETGYDCFTLWFGNSYCRNPAGLYSLEILPHTYQTWLYETGWGRKIRSKHGCDFGKEHNLRSRCPFPLSHYPMPRTVELHRRMHFRKSQTLLTVKYKIHSECALPMVYIEIEDGPRSNVPDC